MLEHVTRGMYYFEVHLLYASIAGCAAWLLTSIRGASATTKYWIWVATLLNFIVPSAAVLDKVEASHLSWAAPLNVIGSLAASLSRGPAASVLCIVWSLGASLMLARVCLRLRADHRDACVAAGQSAVPLTPGLLTHGIPICFAGGRRVPAVDGILHPRISLPTGIDQLLTDHELNAVIIHELTHARRRDNLIRLIYEIVLCGLWFHPLVWITGSRLSLYRELSCDESVIRRAHGGDLLSALAKLADPDFAHSGKPFLLQATASSLLSYRLDRLARARPQQTSRAASTLVTIVFVAALAAGVLGTVAHTACCFVATHVGAN